MHYYNVSYHENVKKHPKKYCYQTYFGPANSILIIEDLAFKDSFISYYSKLELGDNPVFNFPLKTLPQNDPVYVIGCTEDSLLSEVVSYYNRGIKFGGSFTKGWVLTKLLHNNPPNTSK